VDLTGDPARRPDAISGARLADPATDGGEVRRVIAADRIVADTAVRARLYRGRRVVWLDAPEDHLVERLRAARRADVEIQGDYRAFIARHLADYRPYYAAGARVDASGSIAATIEGIERILAEPVPGGTIVLRAELHDGLIELGEGILESSLVHVLQRLAVRRCVVVASDRSRGTAEAALRVGASAGVRVDLEWLPDGAAAKIVEHHELLFRRLAALHLDRSDPLIAIGDDALLEAATFSAAVWLRGVPLVAVPLTTLGLIDTAIGGKGGIDLPGEGRNLLGAFHQPTATILDIALVHDEPPIERRAALAEAVKYGLVGEEGLLALLESERQDDATAWPQATELLELVERCALAKRRVVLRDERDTGDIRIALNLGHTLSHALEVATGHRLRHGEAVAYGLRAALDIGVAMGVTPPAVAARGQRLLRRLGLGQDAVDVAMAEVFDYIEADKKRKAGKLRWVLVSSAGVQVRDDVSSEVARAAVEAAVSGPA
jgi:3-dehydroquinate synthase